MIYQTDTEFSHVIQRYGCYLLSLGYMAAEWEDYTLTHNTVFYVWTIGQKEGFIKARCYIEDPNKVLNSFFSLMRKGHRGNIVQFDKSVWGASNAWIIVYETPNLNTHFCYYTKEGKIQDPYNPEIANKKKIGVRGYRIESV